MRSLLLFIPLFFVISCQQRAPREEVATAAQELQNEFSTPKKVSCQQIQEGDTLVGYVDKYQWLNREGEQRHQYFIYNNSWQILAHLRDDGKTTAYQQSGKRGRHLGNFTLKEAIRRIFNISNVYLFPIQEKNIAISQLSGNEQQKNKVVSNKDLRSSSSQVNNDVLPPEEQPEEDFFQNTEYEDFYEE